MMTGVYFDKIVSAGGAMRYVQQGVQIDLETSICDSVHVGLGCRCLILTLRHISSASQQLLGWSPDTFVRGAGTNEFSKSL